MFKMQFLPLSKTTPIKGLTLLFETSLRALEQPIFYLYLRIFILGISFMFLCYMLLVIIVKILLTTK